MLACAVDMHETRERTELFASVDIHHHASPATQTRIGVFPIIVA